MDSEAGIAPAMERDTAYRQPFTFEVPPAYGSHQARLANGGQHLLGGHFLGQLRKIELLASGGNCPGGNQDDLMSAGLQAGNLAGQVNH